jgi:thiol-disulfide isomerase/thioredoxin
MKNNIIKGIVFLFALIVAQSNYAQGIEFFHGTWAEALAKSKSEGKLIFVDAYAEWCGPCKRMAAQVFPDPKAGEYFNNNFVCLKIDMEKEENAEFASKFPVSAYPTLMFIDDKGALAAKQVGALDVTGLLDLGKKAVGKSDKSVEMQKKYEEGERDPQFLYGYVAALNRAGKPSLKIVNDYLATQKDLTTPLNRTVVYLICLSKIVRPSPRCSPKKSLQTKLKRHVLRPSAKPSSSRMKTYCLMQRLK